MTTVLRATTGDIDPVLQLADESGLSVWSKDAYIREIERVDSIFLVSNESKSRFNGFILGRVVPGNEDDATVAEIYNLGVATSSRRCGIGTGLLNSFIDECRRQNVTEVYLEVRAGNKPAISFYEDRGFSEHSIRRSFYSDPMEDARVMRALI